MNWFCDNEFGQRVRSTAWLWISNNQRERWNNNNINHFQRLFTSFNNFDILKQSSKGQVWEEEMNWRPMHSFECLRKWIGRVTNEIAITNDDWKIRVVIHLGQLTQNSAMIFLRIKYAMMNNFDCIEFLQIDNNFQLSHYDAIHCLWIEKKTILKNYTSHWRNRCVTTHWKINLTSE